MSEPCCTVAPMCFPVLFNHRTSHHDPFGTSQLPAATHCDPALSMFVQPCDCLYLL